MTSATNISAIPNHDSVIGALLASPSYASLTSSSAGSAIASSTFGLSATPTVFLLLFYCVVVIGGILGNVSLVITLCAQPYSRLKNPLLLTLCLADLLVAGVSAPLTIVTLILIKETWTLSSACCKTIHFMKSLPVAASTFCLLMLSLDRYATVKHPRLAQLRERRFLPIFLACSAWIGAGIVSTPIILIYNINPIEEDSDSLRNTCTPDYGSPTLHVLFISLHTVFVFILPSIGVLLNHVGVRKKLCALSLTARAAHGELPLPMPILRRPTHMIIVTGMANAARGMDNGSSSGDDDNHNGVETRLTRETRLKPSPNTPRSIRRAQNMQKKLLQQEQNQPSPQLPLPQTSTLRSRRRLANMLVAAALVFVGCWTPHVICILCHELKANFTCTEAVSDFSLLLGYAHSAISPLMYWILNHNTLKQSPCSPFTRFASAQRFLRTNLRGKRAPPPPSSTNEAALGAFNPRYIKTRPQQYKAPASSHYLY